MSLRTEAMPDNPKMVAFMYGPLVLAADLGTAGMNEVNRFGPNSPGQQIGRLPAVEVPALVAPDVAQLTAKVTPVAGQPLTFETKGLGQPKDVRLVPFNSIFESRYNVYWTVYTPSEWETRKTELAAAAARRKDVESRTVDSVNVSSDASEKAHQYQAGGTPAQGNAQQAAITEGQMFGRRWRSAQRDGSISYQLKIDPAKPVTLVATFLGSEGRRREFVVLVDGEKVATDGLEYHPTELLDREYKVPDQLTKGKTVITVKIQPQPQAATGSLFELRAIQ